MSAAERLTPAPWQILPYGEVLRCYHPRCRSRRGAALIRAGVRGLFKHRPVLPHAVPLGTTIRCYECGAVYELEFGGTP